MDIREMIAEVGDAHSLRESFLAFTLNRETLRDWTFVFGAASGPTPGFAVRRDFSRGAAVRGVFGAKRIVVLDYKTSERMRSGRASYKIDFSISLDTNALSYIEPHIRDGMKKPPGGFDEVFQFIANDDVYVDSLPYIKENLINLPYWPWKWLWSPEQKRNVRRIFEKLEAYEVLRTLDVRHFEDTGHIRSRVAKGELARRAEDSLKAMLTWRRSRATMRELYRGHSSMYALVLKMVQIQLGSTTNSLQNKLTQFLDFCDNEMAAIFSREAVIAQHYFSRGTNLKFFSKMQKNQPKLLPLMRAMAWDLWHVRWMERAFIARPTSEADYFFPAFLTFETGLIEIIDLYPLKSCAYNLITGEIHPFYAGDLFRLLTIEGEPEEDFRSRYFTPQKMTSRQRRRDTAEVRLPALVRNLEREIESIADVRQK